jgi:hypothetical protein
MNKTFSDDEEVRGKNGRFVVDVTISSRSYRQITATHPATSSSARLLYQVVGEQRPEDRDRGVAIF